MQIYRRIEELDFTIESYIQTIIDGACAGAKLLVSDGKIDSIYLDNTYCEDAKSNDSSSVAKNWIRSHEDKLCKISSSGISIIDGISIYTERLGGERTLVICGAGHVSMPIITLGKMIGMHVISIDDREAFADNARRQGADEVICMEFADALEGLASDRNTYFVIATRGHVCDIECLRKIANKPHAYIGLLGSKKRTTKLRDDLASEGISRELLNAVHTPIGLNIGAESPEEIAVSIIAEIIEIKNKERVFGFPGDILRTLLQGEEGKSVLATIIARHGSSPRDMGTKMLVTSDACIGTIGGGIVEAEVIKLSMAMLAGLEAKDVIQIEGIKSIKTNESGLVKLAIYHLNMSSDDSDGRKMLCGGNIDVLLEIV